MCLCFFFFFFLLTVLTSHKTTLEAGMSFAMYTSGTQVRGRLNEISFRWPIPTCRLG